MARNIVNISDGVALLLDPSDMVSLLAARRLRDAAALLASYGNLQEIFHHFRTE